MKKMSRDERLALLRNIIEERHTISTSELQEMFEVSRMTLFRDLDQLQEEGIVEKLYGSVTLTRKLYDIDESLTEHIEEKRLIAQKVLEYIHKNDTILVGAGTSTLEVVKLIAAQDMKVAVVTNSLAAANTVYKTNNIRLFVIGGEYHPETRSLFGPASVETLSRISGRVLILGANAVDPDAGITAHFIDHAELLRHMMKTVKVRIAAIDSSKFGHVCAHHICDLSEIDVLITDSNLDPEMRKALEEKDLDLVIV